ncbi:hypothetical protein ACLOJK_008421 [Asimina triloba]
MLPAFLSCCSKLMSKWEQLIDSDESHEIDADLPTKESLRRKEINREVHTILKNMIEKRENAMKMGEAKNDDLLGLLLESNSREFLERALRLYPPAIFLTRWTNKEMQLGGMTLPAGVELDMHVVLIHHDPDLWGENAEEFNLERSAIGISKATNNQNFAMLEAKLAQAMILQHFSFHLSPSYAHAPCTLIGLGPQHGAPLIIRKL